jgi:uncharacterized protein YdeI (BOF family)
MRFVGFVLGALLLGVGCAKRETFILGQAPNGEARSINSMKAAGPGTRVVLNGVMIEKCPVAGCWFRLRDSTGTIKVDTRGAGFVVAKVPVNSQLQVSGRLVTDGDDVAIEALGIRY